MSYFEKLRKEWAGEPDCEATLKEGKEPVKVRFRRPNWQQRADIVGGGPQAAAVYIAKEFKDENGDPLFPFHPDFPTPEDMGGAIRTKLPPSATDELLVTLYEAMRKAPSVEDAKN